MVYLCSKKIINILWRILAVLVVLSILSQIYRFNFNAGYEGWRIKLFNMDEEYNFPTFYSSMLLLFSAVLLFIISQYYRQTNGKFLKHWMTLSAIFAYISLDEMIVLHEKLTKPLKSLLHLNGMFYFIWLIPFLIVILILALSYSRFLISLPKNFRILFIISAFIYLSGAVLMEVIDGIFANAYGDQNLTYFLLTTVEETLEIVGIMFFINSLMSFINSLNISIRFNELKD